MNLCSLVSGQADGGSPSPNLLDLTAGPAVV